MPTCEKLCYPLQSTEIMNVTCYNGQNEIKCQEATDGTSANITCANYYEPKFGKNSASYCMNGIWTYVPKCVPVCGKKKQTTLPLIVDGEEVKRGNYPWITAVYRRVEYFNGYICDGFLLSQRVVLVAANCVRQDIGKKELELSVQVGKYYSNEADSEDKLAQYSDVDEIIFRNRFKEESDGYVSNIALLVTTDVLVLSEVVQPVCYIGLSNIPFGAVVSGVTAGWRYKSAKGAPSKKIRELVVSIKSGSHCEQGFSGTKTCVEYFNQSRGVCAVDGDEGLFFKNKVDNRYYIGAIASSDRMPYNENCDKEKRVSYEGLSSNANWLITHVSRGSCILEKYPRNGRWKIIEGETGRPDDKMPLNTVLSFECDEGYTLSSRSKYVFCTEEGWNVEKMPTCEKLCQPFLSTTIMDIKCYDQSGEKSCRKATEGTMAEFSCARYFEPRDPRNRTTYCQDGVWIPPPKCIPVCGRKANIDRPLIFNKTEIQRGEFPWIAAIYRIVNNHINYACSGSLLSQRVVVTAAYCVQDEMNNMKQDQSLTVGVGKYYSKYNDSRDTLAQYSNVEQVIFRDILKEDGERYTSNIALLVTRDVLLLSDVVQPVCYNSLPNMYFDSGPSGVVSGWDFKDSDGISTEELQELVVSTKIESQCLQEFYGDKICVEYSNQSNGICMVDGDAGLFFGNDTNNRYYIRGIAVAARERQDDECDIKRSTLYEELSDYTAWFRTSINRGCELEEHPKNGKWRIMGGGTLKPGDILPINSTLTFECYGDYLLSSKNNKVICTSEGWNVDKLPTCKRSCFGSPSGKQMKVRCYDGSEEISCNDAVEGTLANFTCANFYEMIDNQDNTSYCKDGSWTTYFPDCVQVCGRKSETTEPLIVNGMEVKRGSYPWIVAVYQSREFICSGSLLSQWTVLTALHCVEDKENLYIGAGKYYSGYEDTRDMRAQYSAVASTRLNFGTDIAVLITKDILRLSEVVQPVCYTADPNSVPGPLGVISGWGFKDSAGTSSEELRELEVSIEPLSNCPEDYPENKPRFYSCVKYLNQSQDICRVESDAGLFSKTSTDTRFYIQGIAPRIFNNKDCDIGKSTLYEGTRPYIMWWAAIIRETKRDPQCILPDHPDGGRWSTDSPITPEPQPGDSLGVWYSMYFECHQGYKLSSNVNQVTCRDAGWTNIIPKCEKLCEEPVNIESRSVMCKNKEGNTINCNETTDGAIAIISCTENYELEDSSWNTIHCQRGTWNKAPPECKPGICRERPKVTVVSQIQAQVDQDLNENCELPDHPINGHWSYLARKYVCPGDKVPESGRIKFHCDEGYKLSRDKEFVDCEEEGWNVGSMPKCLKLCPAHITTERRLTIKCYKKKKEIKCDEATHGIIAKFTCISNSKPTIKNLACIDGAWNETQPICQAECGEKTVTAVTLVINGSVADKGNYPWTTAIFQKDNKGEYMFICGGSILTQKVILTAAHCVTNIYGDASPKENFQIGVGKHFSNYKDPRDNRAQYSELDELIVHENYKADSQRYSSDIALLIPKNKLRLTGVVQPVCFTDIPNLKLAGGSLGVVTGWGSTEKVGTPAEELHELEVPFKTRPVCEQEHSREWSDKYFAYDKMCTGHHMQSKAVCTGDSGGGLVFKNSRDDRYYIHGIVSITKKLAHGGGCDPDVSALYTSVAAHYDWLNSRVSEYNKY